MTRHLEESTLLTSRKQLYILEAKAKAPGKSTVNHPATDVVVEKALDITEIEKVLSSAWSFYKNKK